MAKKNENKISIDGVDYNLDELSKNAKDHIASIQLFIHKSSISIMSGLWLILLKLVIQTH